MEQIWFDGTPAEALAAIGAVVRSGALDAAAARQRLALEPQSRAVGPELWTVAATAVGDRTRLYWRPGPDVPDGTYLFGTVIPPERIAAVTGWLDTAWNAAAAVHVVEGPAVVTPGFPLDDLRDLDTPLGLLFPEEPAEPAVLAVVTDPAELAAMRLDTMTGTFTGDDCRCLADLTLELRDAGGHLLGAGHLHGHGSVSWEPDRFHNPGRLDDPFAVLLRLMRWGVRGQIRLWYFMLADVMRPELPLRGEAGSPPPTGAGPAALLDWLGSLRVPRDSLRGAGVQGRRLLAAYPAGDVIAAAAADPSPHRLLGAMNWAMYQPDDLPMARALAPAVRRLL
ncbi:hypothetical protein ACFPIJ_60160 [Dactylosporangium cerinum]|uniref:Uncharacterized protein n=1 Tax=Dactylosporangium cerinum TaxID=1434730 RepID=A0ABV9WJV5_9ACTN